MNWRFNAVFMFQVTYCKGHVTALIGGYSRVKIGKRGLHTKQ